MSSGVILLQRPYISFSSPLLLILTWEITAAAVALSDMICGFLFDIVDDLIFICIKRECYINGLGYKRFAYDNCQKVVLCSSKVVETVY